MSKFRIEGNLENVRVKIEGQAKNLDSFMQRVAYKAAEIIEKKANELVPVDTGKLKGGIKVTVTKTDTGYLIVLSNKVEYGVYTEYGCITINSGSPNAPAKIKHGYSPWARPAMLEAVRYVKDELTKFLKD